MAARNVSDHLSKRLAESPPLCPPDAYKLAIIGAQQTSSHRRSTANAIDTGITNI